MVGDGHGRRYQAFALFASSHLVDGAPALRNAQLAYHLFKSMKFIHRAAHCAFRASEMGGGVRWRRRLERFAERYPRSLIGRQCTRRLAPLERIKGRRREVLDLLVSTHKTAKEIGLALGIAEGTVRVHIKQINRILCVTNRAQLVQFVLQTNAA